MTCPFRTVCSTWKALVVEAVLGFEVYGELSVSCWRRNGGSVVQERGASLMGVGAAIERPNMLRRAKTVVVVRIMTNN